ETVYSVLTSRLKKKIPQDVSVLCYRDLPVQQNLQPGLSTFDFPWADIGSEIISVFNTAELWRENSRFHVQIVDRGSVQEQSVKTQSVLSVNPALESAQCISEVI
ncbi:MAG: substrate-binding domain-containing protein, partial [Lentisphaeria bacterium]|nr:substrate-binding domain-containing protein [Lentisphaeria bacterium]